MGPQYLDQCALGNMSTVVCAKKMCVCDQEGQLLQEEDLKCLRCRLCRYVLAWWWGKPWYWRCTWPDLFQDQLEQPWPVRITCTRTHRLGPLHLAGAIGDYILGHQGAPVWVAGVRAFNHLSQAVLSFGWSMSWNASFWIAFGLSGCRHSLSVKSWRVQLWEHGWKTRSCCPAEVLVSSARLLTTSVWPELMLWPMRPSWDQS